MSRPQQQNNNVQRLVAHLESEEGHEQLQKHAPDGVSKGEVQRLALHLLQSDDGNLSQCSPASLVGAILQAQHLGVDLTMEEAYLIPRGGEAQLRVSYQGLVKLAKESDKVEHVFADVVHEHDDWTYKRTLDGIEFEHDPVDFGDRGELVGTYCVVKYANGTVDIERMDRDAIDTVRSKASQYSGAWNDFYAEMAKKSVTRRALKWVDLSPNGKEAIQQTREEFDYSDESDSDRQLEAESGNEDLKDVFDPDDNSEPEQLPEAEEETSTAESEPDDDAADDIDWSKQRRRLGQLLRHCELDVEREAVEDAIAEHHGEFDVARLGAETFKGEVDAIDKQPSDGSRARYLTKLLGQDAPKSDANGQNLGKDGNKSDKSDQSSGQSRGENAKDGQNSGKPRDKSQPKLAASGGSVVPKFNFTEPGQLNTDKEYGNSDEIQRVYGTLPDSIDEATEESFWDACKEQWGVDSRKNVPPHELGRLADFLSNLGPSEALEYVHTLASQ